MKMKNEHGSENVASKAPESSPEPPAFLNKGKTQPSDYMSSTAFQDTPAASFGKDQT